MEEPDYESIRNCKGKCECSLFYMLHGDISYTDEAMYADRLSTVYDDIYLARSTQNTIREFIRNHPTVYCGTHTPLGYENLEAGRL